MKFPLEVVIEEHEGLSPGFGRWHIVAKRPDLTVGVYYINFRLGSDGLVIYESKIKSYAPQQHIPRLLITECVSFLATKARELNQLLTHPVRFAREEERQKLRHLFVEQGYTDQGRSQDGRYDWMMTRTYENR